MRNSILSYIKTTARLFRQVRRARKEGVEIKVRKQAPLTVIDTSPSLIHTVEGCTLLNCGIGMWERMDRWNTGKRFRN